VDFDDVVKGGHFLGWARSEFDVATQEIEVEYPLQPEPWHVFARFRVDDGTLLDGTLLMAELRVFPGPDRVGLDWRSEKWPELGEADHWTEASHLGAEVLRGIPVGDLRQIAIGCYRGYMGHRAIRTATGKKIRERVKEATRRPGRAGREDAFYAQWAALYVDKARSKAPIAELANEYGLRPEQVRDLVHTARERGLLGRGRDGLLTKKAHLLLKD